MGNTIIEKIFKKHSDSPIKIDDIVDITIDIRAARDFGGANVVKNLQEHNLTVDDPNKTVFTFDCNPGGCDQKYAANQHICRQYARQHGIRIFDIQQGIGTHLAFEQGLITPGDTFVSTDSHANILGALGAFGQGMGDKDIAHAFAHGKTWFKVPPSVKIILKGTPSALATPKDVVLKMLRDLGANGLLGYAAEMYGPYVEQLSLDGRVTMASMATEMGGIIMLFPTNQAIEHYYTTNFNRSFTSVRADENATYEKEIIIDIQDIPPQIARPGHPEDVIDVSEVEGTPIDSGFIGSCTNGRGEDLHQVATLLQKKHIAPGRILKIVPSTDSIWKLCLDKGYITTFKQAGALIGSAGCAGCAAGQIGQTGEGEVAVSSGNRNYVGKQGKGDIYLASPATVAASLIAGAISIAEHIPAKPYDVPILPMGSSSSAITKHHTTTPMVLQGKAWVLDKDNIDTDMIYHNQYLSITNLDEMGQYCLGNLKGFEDFASKVKTGDIVVAGKNFGCGSSRQQAVDCFKALGVPVIIAESFGSIYERNAINNALPILLADEITSKIQTGDTLQVDLLKAVIINQSQNTTIQAKSFSQVQKNIYERGGLLER